MNKIFILLSLSVLLFGVEPLKVDSALSALDDYEYFTPKGKTLKIPAQTVLILVTFEKSTSDLLNDYLKTKNKYYLQQNKLVYIADISRTPRLITNMFALPKLKKLKHLIYLQYGKKLRNRIPNKDNTITLLRVKDGQITNIVYATNTEEIQGAIEQK